MSRAYTIYLVSTNVEAPLKVDADNVDLEFGEDSNGADTSPHAFRFTKGTDDNQVNVAWVPFEMVRAIVS